MKFLLLSLAFLGSFAPANRNWARLQGTLKTGVAGDMSGKVPEDYQDLVREYFQVINKQTGGAEAP